MNRLIVLVAFAFCACSSPPASSNLELKETEWIPFDLHNDQQLFIRGSINGQEVDIVVDTGAEISLIDENFAAAIGVQKGKATKLRGVGGGADTSLARGIEFACGNLLVHEPTVAAPSS